MKKQMKLAMAAILLTGATALADSPSDTEVMITNGKIAAIQIEIIRGQINHLLKMQDVLGTSQDIQDVKGQDVESLSPSQHLLSDLGQQIDNAQTELKAVEASENYDAINDLAARLDKQVQADQVELNALLNN